MYKRQVLEQLQGMSVIKSFNLAGKGDRRLREALEYNRQSNLAIEKRFTPYNIAQSLSPVSYTHLKWWTNIPWQFILPLLIMVF